MLEYTDRLFTNDFYRSGILTRFSSLCYEARAHLPAELPDELSVLIASVKPVSQPRDGVEACLEFIYTLFVGRPNCDFDIVMEILGRKDSFQGRSSMRLMAIESLIDNQKIVEENREIIVKNEGIGNFLRSVLRQSRISEGDNMRVSYILETLPELLMVMYPDGISFTLGMNDTGIAHTLGKLKQIPLEICNEIAAWALCSESFPMMGRYTFEAVQRAIDGCDKEAIAAATTIAIEDYIEMVSKYGNNVMGAVLTLARKAPQSVEVITKVCAVMIGKGRSRAVEMMVAVIKCGTDDDVLKVVSALAENYTGTRTLVECSSAITAMEERLEKTTECPDWAVCVVAWFAASYSHDKSMLPLLRMFASKASDDQALAVAASANNDQIVLEIVKAKRDRRELFETCCDNYSVKCALRNLDKETN